MASDDQKASIRCKSDALDRILLPIEVKELKTLKLEVVAIILIDLEDFKDSLFVAHCKIFPIWRKIATFRGVGQLYGVD